MFRRFLCSRKAAALSAHARSYLRASGHKIRYEELRTAQKRRRRHSARLAHRSHPLSPAGARIRAHREMGVFGRHGTHRGQLCHQSDLRARRRDRRLPFKDGRRGQGRGHRHTLHSAVRVRIRRGGRLQERELQLRGFPHHRRHGDHRGHHRRQSPPPRTREQVAGMLPFRGRRPALP